MIIIDNISKSYKIYDRRSDRLREWVSFGRKKLHRNFTALHNINLKVPNAGVTGIIGMNGAGKSTLLKILTGTTQPTTGSVKIEGRIAALLELGTGFHPELTGRDNVIVNGKLLGLTNEEIHGKLDEIRAFCELGDFFDKPLRTYSSGMYVRLAFSLAASVDPDVLIIDEALSVGDAYFQQKCLKRIQEFKAKGVTILFVSHDPGAIKLLCDHVVLLDQGRIVSEGSPQDLLEMYNALLAKKDGNGAEYAIARGAKDAFGKDQLIAGNYKAKIAGVRLQNLQGERLEAVVAGDHCQIVVDIDFMERLENPTVGILLRDRLGYDVFGTNSAELFLSTGTFTTAERGRFVFDCRMNLGPGSYTVTAAVHTSTTHVDECYQWVDRILTFNVLPRTDYRFIGVSHLEPKLEVQRLLTSS